MPDQYYVSIVFFLFVKDQFTQENINFYDIIFQTSLHIFKLSTRKYHVYESGCCSVVLSLKHTCRWRNMSQPVASAITQRIRGTRRPFGGILTTGIQEARKRRNGAEEQQDNSEIMYRVANTLKP